MNRHTSQIISSLLFLSVLVSACTQEPEASLPEHAQLNQTLSCDTEGQLELFDRRIRPMLDEEKPNSCARCHLPGTNLSAFVRPDPCDAMACMAQEKLVDFDAPANSKILDWIKRGHAEAGLDIEEDPLVLGEYNAFKEWIEYSARCHVEVCGQIANACGWTSEPSPIPGEDMDIADMGSDMTEEIDFGPCGEEGCPLTPEYYGCEDDEIARAYFDHPWKWRGRCSHCHGVSSNFNVQPPPPPWMADDRGIDGAAYTVEQILDRGYIDRQFPEDSLILIKPLSEAAGGIPHGGGTKVRDTADVLHVAHSEWINHVLYCEGLEDQ